MALELDTVLTHLGGYGRFQMLTFCYIGLIAMRGVWHILGISFLGATPEHHCKIPSGAEPYKTLNDANELVLDSCKQYTNFSVSNATAACIDGWEYESEGTIIVQWDLVCDRAYLLDLSTSVFMGGLMFGGIFINPFADRFGRKWIVISMLVLQSLLGTVTAFVNNFIAFVVLRFFIAATNQAAAMTAYVMLTEAFPPDYRTRPGIALQFFWAAGICLLALFAWLLPNWRHLQLVISVPTILVLLLICLLQESLPWLVMKNKLKEAERGLARIAKINKVPLPENTLTDSTLTKESLVEAKVRNSQKHINLSSQSALEDVKLGAMESCDVKQNWEGKTDFEGDPPVQKTSSEEEHIYTTLDLFRYPKIRCHTILIFFIWLISALDYWGISLSVPSLYGDVYVNSVISGLVEIPAYLLVMFALDIFGRRRPLALLMFISGIANIATAFTPEKTSGGTDLRTVITVLAMIGKSAITGAFATVFLFAAELFPTVLRNAGIGLASLGDSIGGIIAPLILLTATERTDLPRAIFGALAIFAALAVLVLPETHRRSLPETIDDVEKAPGGLCSCGEDAGAQSSHL